MSSTKQQTVQLANVNILKHGPEELVKMKTKYV